MKKNKVKNLLVSKQLLALAGGAVLLTPLTIVACSSSANTNISQQWIDETYRKFENSILTIENNVLYKEYFDVNNTDANGWFKIDQAIINKILNNSNLENTPEVQEQYFGKIENNTLLITYKLFKVEDEGQQQELKASFTFDDKKISNIKSLSENDKEEIKKILESWQSHDIKIKNDATELEKNKYSDIPTLLLKSDRNDENNKFFSETLKSFTETNAKDKNFKLKFLLDFQDQKINIKLNVIFDDFLNIPILLDKTSSDKQLKTITGFKQNAQYQKEVEEIYKPLGRYYDLSEFNSQKEYPRLASSIYDVEQVGIFLNEIKEKVNDENKFKLPEFFDQSKTSNLWYELKVDINANDIIGTVNADFTIVDKFTKTEIRPQNVTKIMTLNKFHPLVADRDKKEDYATMENVYQAYKLFEKINLNDKNQTLASKDPSLNIDFDWLKNQTDFSKGKEFEVSFDLSQIEKPEEKPASNLADADATSKKVTNKFRVLKFNNKKVDQTGAAPYADITEDKIKQEIVNDDVIGVKKIPVVLQIQLNIEGQKQDQWYTVLPHIKTINGTIEEDFSAKSADVKYAQIGGYRDNDLDTSGKIYQEFSGDNTQILSLSTKATPAKPTKIIEIPVNEDIFKELSVLKQKEAVDKLETQGLLTEQIRMILSQSTDMTINENIDRILDKFNFFINLSETKNLKSENDTSNNNKVIKLKTDEVELKLTSKTDNLRVFQNIDQSGTDLGFPKVQVVIKLDNNAQSTQQILEKQINRAFKTVNEFMNDQSYVYADKKPSEFQIGTGQGQTPLKFLDPKQNYGYVSSYDTAGSNNQQDDDNKGTKTIGVTLTRGKQQQKFKVTLTGFLTTAQTTTRTINDTDLDVKEYLNLKTETSGSTQTTHYYSHLKLKDGIKVKATEISNYLNGEKLKEIIEVEKEDATTTTTPFKSLLKKKLAANVELRLANIRQNFNSGINTPEILADVQLVKKVGDELKTSAKVELVVTGFEINDDFLTETLLDQIGTAFSTYDSPVKKASANPSNNVDYYNSKKATEIKTLDDLAGQLDRVTNKVYEYQNPSLGNQVITIKLLTLIDGSQNDQNGSLKVRIELSFKDKSDKKPIEKEITLFGFKPEGTTK